MAMLERFRSLFSKRPLSPAEMISALLDKSQDLGSRHDIAMDIFAFDLPEVEEALIIVASDPGEEEMIIDAAGESLAQIYKRQNRKPPTGLLNKLQPSAKKFF